MLYSELVQNAMPIIEFLQIRHPQYEELTIAYNSLKNTMRQQFLTLEEAAAGSIRRVFFSSRAADTKLEETPL